MSHDITETDFRPPAVIFSKAKNSIGKWIDISKEQDISDGDKSTCPPIPEWSYAVRPVFTYAMT